MKRFAALFLALLLALSMFAITAVAEEEDKVVRIGVAVLPSNMDPATGIGNANTQMYFNCFDMILYDDPYDNFNKKSYICDSWTMIDDYTTEFKVKEGITFHNGEPLTAEDIVFSLDRLINGEKGYVGSTVTAIVATVDRAEVIDDYTFRVITKVPDMVITSRLASTLGAYVVPKDYIEEVGNEAFGQAPIGSGPYKVVEFSPEKVVFEPYEGYYGEAPAADRIEYVLYSEISARVSALIAGDCDIILQVSEDMQATIESYDDLKYGTITALTYYMLQFDTANGPMASKEFRQALSLAIDRQALCDAFFMGNATIPNGYNFPEYGDYYIEDYPYYEYNPEKAKELIAASGYDGTEITYKLRSGYYTYADETAEAIVAMWNEVGVNARVEFINAGDQWEYVTNWSNGIRFTDPAGGLWLLWGADSGKNDPEKGHWKDMPQEYIDAGRAFESSMDFEERYALNKKIMEIWDDECHGTILFQIPESWAYSADLHFSRGANRMLSMRAEHFWFEDAE